uniref:Transcriptional regulator n=1 Tax=Steinernema glaseri TaxID=37863 RepID=A0A1I8AFZ1_9BILA
MGDFIRDEGDYLMIIAVLTDEFVVDQLSMNLKGTKI